MRHLIASILFFSILNLIGQDCDTNPIAVFSTELISIPDGGCIDIQYLLVNEFPSNSMFNSEDIYELSLYMNIEHSYLGDLTITYHCPNGQAITVQSGCGGAYYMGEPVDFDSEPDTHGVGYDYQWSNNASNGTLCEFVYSADFNTDNYPDWPTIPSDYYESNQSFISLDGCPLNGTWGVEVCDAYPSDNGFVFSWGIIGECMNIEITGCTDPTAINYDSTATSDDGSCMSLECASDLNNDNSVTVTDLLQLLAVYGCTSDCVNDVNFDGLVTVGDILDILTVFGSECQ